jgi:hypothetical protein
MAGPNSFQKKTTLRLYQRSVVTAVVVLVYLVACCCPALRFDNYYPGNSAPQSSDTWFGWTALLLGWLGIAVGSVAWLANFVLGLTLIFLMCGLRWATLISSAVTVLLSFDFFPVLSAHIPADEGGVGRAVLRPPEIGVWLWFASIAAAFVGAWILFLAPRKGVQGVQGRVSGERESQPRTDPPPYG